jgi:hypothetical protein
MGKFCAVLLAFSYIKIPKKHCFNRIFFKNWGNFQHPCLVAVANGIFLFYMKRG